MSAFQLEDRYIVIKYSDMEKLPNDVRRNFSGRCRSFYEQMLIAGAPARSFLVIESDWPEYVPAWLMIEQRVNGTTGGEPEVVAVINEEGEHFKETVVEHRPGIDRLPVGTELVDRAHVTRLQAERDALQQRLTTADQRIDDLISAVRSINRGPAHIVVVPGDDEPQYRQRKEWIDWILGLCDEASTSTEPIKEDDWRMNTCQKGHRDVGAAGGIAHCYQCDEKIVAATTQEAFDQWSAAHPFSAELI